MEYQAAMDILHRRRIHRPAIVEMAGGFHVFERTTLLGSGRTIKAAMIDAGMYPPVDIKVIQYSAKGREVIRGREPICIAESNNKATRIANALNAYVPNQHGY
jgi:hypothetical protein